MGHDPIDSATAAAAKQHDLPLSVVIPVHDEAANIGALIDEVATALEGLLAFELVVVDDCSADDTASVLAAAASARPWLRRLRHRSNAGQSAALRSGIEAARGRWIATLDGDGQNDPADLPKLLALVDLEAPAPVQQLIAGYRRRRHDGWLKRVSSKVANAVRRRLLRDGTPDTGCGLKLFERQLFLSLPLFDHFHRFLPALVRLRGASVTSVEVNHRPRRGGRSHYGVADRLWVGIVDLCGVMWLARRSRLPVVEELHDGAPDGQQNGG
ncbi:MAG: glycosyltransferase family 2 protein [Alphaproteobacteria bacterium]|nr:glycosyltransferase family 2 protein [Alphaproteobacteria bacterium]